MIERTAEDGLDRLAPLADPVRRRLYLHVIGQPEPVGREAAAEALGIGRSLAAFHLDRLVEAGLLVTEYRRLSGRRGPGAGRPAKLYRASDDEVSATVPERRYEVAAELFARTLASSEDAVARLDGEAAVYGTQLGLEARRRAGREAGRSARVAALEAVLRDAGYVPFVHDGELRMRNCPFHRLAEDHRELTCGMNLALLRGVLAGAGLPADAARLDQQPGMCCVAIDADPSGQ